MSEKCYAHFVLYITPLHDFWCIINKIFFGAQYISIYDCPIWGQRVILLYPSSHLMIIKPWY